MYICYNEWVSPAYHRRSQLGEFAKVLFNAITLYKAYSQGVSGIVQWLIHADMVCI